MKERALVPPKRTAVAALRFVPVMTIVVPAVALAGVNDAMAGAGTKRKPSREPAPLGDCTVMVAVMRLVPSTGTRTVIVESFVMEKDCAAAVVPPDVVKRTAVTPEKSLPLSVIVCEAPALSGLKDVTTGGAGIKIKFGAVARPPGV